MANRNIKDEKEKEVLKFIEEKVNEIKPLSKKTSLSYFNAAITGKKEFYKKYEEYQVKLEKIFNKKKDYEKIKKFQDYKIKNPLIKRQLKILYNSFLGSQGDLKILKKIIKISTVIEKKFNVFRAQIGNKKLTDNEIKEILQKETDSKKLKQAWEASKKQGGIVEKELLDLIKLRNKIAKNLGFNNYYELSLAASEQKEKDIEKIFNELDRLTNKPFKNLKKEIDEFLSKKYKIKEKELKPWHYYDLFFQEGPEIYKIDLDKYYKNHDVIKIAKEFYKSIGLPVEDILNRSDLYEKPGKYQHACCIDIDRVGDVRIIENVKNNEKWMDTTLHELGHAVYDKFIDKNLPYFLRHHAHIFVTESIAMLFGRNSKNSSFIEKYSKIRVSKKSKKKLIKMLRLRQLVFSRWSQVMFRFERELYKNPGQNLNKVWWNLVKKYQLINFSRDNPDWASKIHFVSSPVYYHNYLLGELLASQTHNYIVKKILKKDSLNNIDYSNKKEIGKYLKKNLFSIGKKLEWNELIKKATGEPLTSKYFVKQFVG